MSVMLISYDLGKPETAADYSALISKIKSYGDWCKPEYSLWFVKTYKDTTTVRDELKGYLDRNDRLLVMAVTGDGWASYNLPTDAAAWMQANI